MRFMIIVKATADSEAGTMPGPDLLAEMGAFHQELAQAGVLLDAAGLKPSSTGWRIHYNSSDSGGQQTAVDGPFTDTRELIAGYTLIEVASREAALEWTRRYPCPAGRGNPAQIEVRQLFEMSDFESPAPPA